MKNLITTAFTSLNGVVKQENGSQRFTVKRAPIGEKFIMDNPLYTFTMDCPIELEEYVVIEYDCFGIKRTPNVYQGPFMTLKKGEENIPLYDGFAGVNAFPQFCQSLRDLQIGRRHTDGAAQLPPGYHGTCQHMGMA